MGRRSKAAPAWPGVELESQDDSSGRRQLEAVRPTFLSPAERFADLLAQAGKPLRPQPACSRDGEWAVFPERRRNVSLECACRDQKCAQEPSEHETCFALRRRLGCLLVRKVRSANSRGCIVLSPRKVSASPCEEGPAREPLLEPSGSRPGCSARAVRAGVRPQAWGGSWASTRPWRSVRDFEPG